MPTFGCVPPPSCALQRHSWASSRAPTRCPAAAASCRRCASAAPASRLAASAAGLGSWSRALVLVPCPTHSPQVHCATCNSATPLLLMFHSFMRCTSLQYFDPQADCPASVQPLLADTARAHTGTPRLSCCRLAASLHLAQRRQDRGKQSSRVAKQQDCAGMQATQHGMPAQRCGTARHGHQQATQQAVAAAPRRQGGWVSAAPPARWAAAVGCLVSCQGVMRAHLLALPLLWGVPAAAASGAVTGDWSRRCTTGCPLRCIAAHLCAA